jgi:sugar O-acyltransferase (sialic acid O-acetyltransferase NeuD family)
MIAAGSLILLGAGGHARETYALILAAGMVERFGGFAEDDAPAGKTIYGHPVYDTKELERKGPAGITLCAAIGSPARRRLVEQFEAQGFEFETLWHPSAQRGPRVEVGRGTMVAANTALVADVTIGNHVVLNVGSIVSHDSSVGDFTTISPGSCLNGGVHLGVEVFVGSGAVFIPGVLVGDRAVIGAGACVIHDVAPGTTVAGVPAKVIRRGG